MTISTVNQEKIYDLNFNENQIEFLRNTKISKTPTIMSAIENFYLSIKKPGCYNEPDQILIKEKDRLIISKLRDYALVEGQNENGYFSTTLKWTDYVELTQRNTYVPIAVFTIN